jgi:hypothetical protein
MRYRVRVEEIGADDSLAGVQEVFGAPETVAAFLRAMADQLNPPQRVTRARDAVVPKDDLLDCSQEREQRRPQFDILPRPTP